MNRDESKKAQGILAEVYSRIMPSSPPSIIPAPEKEDESAKIGGLLNEINKRRRDGTLSTGGAVKDNPED